MPIVDFPNRDPKLLQEIVCEYQRLRSVELAFDSLADMAYGADGASIANVIKVLAGELTSCTDTFSSLVSRLEKM